MAENVYNNLNLYIPTYTYVYIQREIKNLYRYECN